MHNNVSLLYCMSASGLAPHLYLKEDFAAHTQLSLSVHLRGCRGRAAGEQDMHSLHTGSAPGPWHGAGDVLRGGTGHR